MKVFLWVLGIVALVLFGWVVVLFMRPKTTTVVAPVAAGPTTAGQAQQWFNLGKDVVSWGQGMFGTGGDAADTGV